MAEEFDVKAFAQDFGAEVVIAVKDYVRRQMAPIEARLDALEKRAAA